MAMATINLTPVIVVFGHVVIVLMLEMIVDNRILEPRHCQISCAFSQRWCRIDVEDNGFIRSEVAFSAMLAVAHRYMFY